MPIAYGIRNKETKEQWRAKSGKTVWAKPAHAKAAWRSTYEYCYKRPEGIISAGFNDQDLYEVFIIGFDEAARLAKAEELLAAAHEYLEDVHAGESAIAGEILDYFAQYGE